MVTVSLLPKTLASVDTGVHCQVLWRLPGLTVTCSLLAQSAPTDELSSDPAETLILCLEKAIPCVHTT